MLIEIFRVRGVGHDLKQSMGWRLRNGVNLPVRANTDEKASRNRTDGRGLLSISVVDFG
jgi:hypothetical protein